MELGLFKFITAYFLFRVLVEVKVIFSRLAIYQHFHIQFRGLCLWLIMFLLFSPCIILAFHETFVSTDLNLGGGVGARGIDSVQNAHQLHTKGTEEFLCYTGTPIAPWVFTPTPGQEFSLNSSLSHRLKTHNGQTSKFYNG